MADHVAGSASAFGELVARHQHRLWAVALRLVRDPDDAADVLQDAVVKAFRAAPSFRGEAQVSTWLHRIVVTTALDGLRRAGRAEVLALTDDRSIDAAASAARGDPLDAHAVVLDVSAALGALPPDQRAAIVLVDMHGFSVAEAADILGCRPGTVKSRCFRGRARLATVLSAYRPGPSGDRAPRWNQTGGPDVEGSGAPRPGDHPDDGEARR